MSTYLTRCLKKGPPDCWECDCPTEIMYSMHRKGDYVEHKSDGVVFTSDLHLGHVLAGKLRGYDNVHEHDQAIINMLGSQTNKRTTLWILGDVAMRLDSLYMLASLSCRKIMVAGNHDKFPLEEYARFFDRIYGLIRYKKMWISHCPIHETEMYRCKLNVHGHVHHAFAKTGKVVPKLPLPYFNVNWDLWGRAVTLSEIRAVIPGDANVDKV